MGRSVAALSASYRLSPLLLFLRARLTLSPFAVPSFVTPPEADPAEGASVPPVPAGGSGTAATSVTTRAGGRAMRAVPVSRSSGAAPCPR